MNIFVCCDTVFHFTSAEDIIRMWTAVKGDVDIYCPEVLVRKTESNS